MAIGDRVVVVVDAGAGTTREWTIEARKAGRKPRSTRAQCGSGWKLRSLPVPVGAFDAAQPVEIGSPAALRSSPRNRAAGCAPPHMTSIPIHSAPEPRHTLRQTRAFAIP